LRAALDPALIRAFADAAELPAATAKAAEKTQGKRQSEFLDTAWARCELLLPEVHAAWQRITGHGRHKHPTRPESLGPVYRKCLRNAMRLLSVEGLMPSPWAATARRVLPASSPEVAGAALWGPVLSWCLLEILAEAIDGDNVQQTALDLFDQLRLRESLAQAFQSIGLEGEEGWRAAARLKVLLMIESGAGRTRVSPQSVPAGKSSSNKLSQAAEALASEATSSTPKAKAADTSRLPTALWQDPDVRWLTGHNEGEGHAYVNREQFEELLWWLALPELLKVANMAAPTRAAGAAISRSIAEEMTALEKAGYRVDLLVKGPRSGPADQPDATTLTLTALGSKPGVNAPMADPVELEPEEPLKAKSVGPADADGPPEDF
jgi:hypothetical protein